MSERPWEDPDWDDLMYMADDTAKSLAGMVEALGIFARYFDGGLGKKYFCGAEHDELHIYVSPDHLDPISEDGLRLRCLGFHPNAETDGWSYFT